MRLELVSFPVTMVRRGTQTRYQNGALEIDIDDLSALVMSDPKVASADLDIALPGEKTRIVRVRDAVEPRIKVAGPGAVFPGILGPVETVGEGRTHRLAGLTVIVSAEYERTIFEGTAAGRTGLVDMWGLAGELTPFGSTINIVLKIELRGGISELEAHTAIQLAELRLARALAETTRQLIPKDVEVFETGAADPSLPRVVYVLGCRTAWHEPHSGVALYGLPIRESFPTLIHPNEFLDGAFTSDARRGGRGTFPRYLVLDESAGGIAAAARAWQAAQFPGRDPAAHPLRERLRQAGERHGGVTNGQDAPRRHRSDHSHRTIGQQFHRHHDDAAGLRE